MSVKVSKESMPLFSTSMNVPFPWDLLVSANSLTKINISQNVYVLPCVNANLLGYKGIRAAFEKIKMTSECVNFKVQFLGMSLF